MFPFFYIYNNVVAIDLCTDSLRVTLARPTPSLSSSLLRFILSLIRLNRYHIVIAQRLFEGKTGKQLMAHTQCRLMLN